jgi:hypothetical protein
MSTSHLSRFKAIRYIGCRTLSPDPMTPNSIAIEQFNTLTPAHQQQVVDFVAFLKSREQVKAVEAIAGEYKTIRTCVGIIMYKFQGP